MKAHCNSDINANSYFHLISYSLIVLLIISQSGKGLRDCFSTRQFDFSSHSFSARSAAVYVQ